MLGFPSHERVTIEGLPVHLHISSHLPLTSSCKDNLLSNARNEHKWAQRCSYTVITTLFKWAIFCNNLNDLLEGMGLILWLIYMMGYYKPAVINYVVDEYLSRKENVPDKC